MISNFNIATDLKVELFIPTSIINPFILGVSLLGGPDVLDGDLNPLTNWEWVPIEATVSEATIQVGGTIESNIAFAPEPASLNIRLQTYDYDPSVNSSVRAGTDIRVRVTDGALVDETLFKGKIDTIDVSYSPAADKPNIISISAVDGYKKFVNSRIATYDTTGLPAGYATPLEVFDIIATETGLTLSASSDNIPGKIPTVSETNQIASKYINEALLVGLGLAWIDQATGELILKARPVIDTTPPLGTYTVGDNHGDAYHLCMSDLTVSSDVDAIFNTLKVELESDPTTYVVLQDAGSVDLYGETSLNIAVNTTDTTELDRWANAVFNAHPGKIIRTITTPTIDRTGELTAAAAFTPGTLIGVQFTREPLVIDTYYNVTRVTHTIDPKTWFTELELWKES